MAGKRDKPEVIISKLRQVEVLQGQGSSVADAVRQIGATQQTFYRWRKQYGGMGTNQLKRLKEVEKENQHLRRAVSDLTLDKLVLKESLDFFKAESLTTTDLRQAVIHVRQKLGTSERRTCREIGVARSTQQ